MKRYVTTVPGESTGSVRGQTAAAPQGIIVTTMTEGIGGLVTVTILLLMALQVVRIAVIGIFITGSLARPVL